MASLALRPHRPATTTAPSSRLQAPPTITAAPPSVLQEASQQQLFTSPRQQKGLSLFRPGTYTNILRNIYKGYARGDPPRCALKVDRQAGKHEKLQVLENISKGMSLVGVRDETYCIPQ